MCEGSTRIPEEMHRTLAWFEPMSFPASGGSVLWARFWHYQFANTTKTRAYLYNKSQEYWRDDDLRYEEIDWAPNGFLRNGTEHVMA